MERGVMAGPDFGRRSSDGYKRVSEPRSSGCPETPLARLAIDAGLGIRHASLHSPVTWAFAVAHTDRKWPYPRTVRPLVRGAASPPGVYRNRNRIAVQTNSTFVQRLKL